MQRVFTSHASARRHYLRFGSALALLTVALILATRDPSGAAPPDGPSDKEPTIDGRPLFDSWPGKGAQKPDAAIILTGQTFGLLQPCGCSRPQKGGLERRAQLINMLKNKGWPVAGVDLGDIYPDKASFRDQGLLRYKTAMNSLHSMGYIAVGLGKTEFSAEIDKIVGEYALQKEQPPFVLAANLMGLVQGKAVPIANYFPPPKGATRPLIGDLEVAKVGSVSIGVAGLVGKSLAEEVEKAKLDPSVTFVKVNDKIDNAGVLKNSIAALKAKKSQINVLIYQGTAEEARTLAKAWPDFNIILCQADDPEPPQFPVVEGRTLIVQVGHKGRYVGVVGAFKKGAGFELHYQLVPLDEYYVTPGKDDIAFKSNAILPLLDEYARTVRDAKTANGKTFLEEAPRKLHNSQVANPKWTYVGSETCKVCHMNEYNHWEKQTAHSHALNTLKTVAKRPTLRNFDPECVVCHTVGFEYKSGYVDEKQTPKFMHVGCESCHGPGSGHVGDPRNQAVLKFMSEWKGGPNAKLPQELLEKLAKTKAVDRGSIKIQPADQFIINNVAKVCARCHDHENDPHFDFPTYWPKVNHTGLAGGGAGPPPVPEKK